MRHFFGQPLSNNIEHSKHADMELKEEEIKIKKKNFQTFLGNPKIIIRLTNYPNLKSFIEIQIAKIRSNCLEKGENIVSTIKNHDKNSNGFVNKVFQYKNNI